MFDIGSLRLGRLFGIEIRLHWLFLAFLGLLTLSSTLGGGAASGLWTLGFLSAVFVCVALHELGHSLAARAYGVKTHHITLLPIGGVAQMDLRGVKPSAEVWIALAGPAVNFALALVLLPIALLGLSWFGWTLPVWLLGANLVMGTFNLLPAFPLDGGRVLRAALTVRSGDHVRATEQATTVGKVVAVLLGIAGLLFDFWLVILAVVIWFLGEREKQLAYLTAGSRGAGFDFGGFLRGHDERPGPAPRPFPRVIFYHQGDLRRDAPPPAEPVRPVWYRVRDADAEQGEPDDIDRLLRSWATRR